MEVAASDLAEAAFTYNCWLDTFCPEVLAKLEKRMAQMKLMKQDIQSCRCCLDTPPPDTFPQLKNGNQKDQKKHKKQDTKKHKRQSKKEQDKDQPEDKKENLRKRRKEMDNRIGYLLSTGAKRELEEELENLRGRRKEMDNRIGYLRRTGRSDPALAQRRLKVELRIIQVTQAFRRHYAELGGLRRTLRLALSRCLTDDP